MRVLLEVGDKFYLHGPITSLKKNRGFGYVDEQWLELLEVTKVTFRFIGNNRLQPDIYAKPVNYVGNSKTIPCNMVDFEKSKDLLIDLKIIYNIYL